MRAVCEVEYGSAEYGSVVYECTMCRTRSAQRPHMALSRRVNLHARARISVSAARRRSLAALSCFRSRTVSYPQCDIAFEKLQPVAMAALSNICAVRVPAQLNFGRQYFGGQYSAANPADQPIAGFDSDVCCYSRSLVFRLVFQLHCS